MPATRRDLGPDYQIRAAEDGRTRIHNNWLPWTPGDDRWPHLPQYEGFVLLGVGEFICNNDVQGELRFYVPVYQHLQSRECLEAAGVELDKNGSHPACEYVRLPPFGEDGKFVFGGGDMNYDIAFDVEIVNPYLIGRTVIVQAVYEGIMGTNPSFNPGPLNPVEQVSWDDAQAFCQRAGFRLPSETQWEYACRGGSQTVFCFGDNPARLPKFAWFSENSNGLSQPVAGLQANAFGLFDVHGNVWEWCQDEWHDLQDGARTDGSAWGDDEPYADPMAPWHRMAQQAGEEDDPVPFESPADRGRGEDTSTESRHGDPAGRPEPAGPALPQASAQPDQSEDEQRLRPHGVSPEDGRQRPTQPIRPVAGSETVGPAATPDSAPEDEQRGNPTSVATSAASEGATLSRRSLPNPTVSEGQSTLGSIQGLDSESSEDEQSPDPLAGSPVLGPAPKSAPSEVTADGSAVHGPLLPSDTTQTATNGHATSTERAWGSEAPGDEQRSEPSVGSRTTVPAARPARGACHILASRSFRPEEYLGCCCRLGGNVAPGSSRIGFRAVGG